MKIQNNKKDFSQMKNGKKKKKTGEKTRGKKIGISEMGWKICIHIDEIYTAVTFKLMLF